MFQKKHNFSADFMRMVAISMVVVIHVISQFLNDSSWLNSIGWIFAILVETAAKIAVPLFIMLSGLLLLDPQKNYPVSAFYKKRLSKIGIPILFWPIFYYFSFLFVSHKAFSLMGFVNDYIFLNTFYHLYFLYIILGLYIIAPFLKKMFIQVTRLEEKWLICGSFIFSICVTFLVYFTPSKINYWSIFTVFIPFIGYFLAGSYLSNVKLSKKQLQVGGVVFIALVGVTAVCKYFAYNSGSPLFIRYFDDALSINVILQSLLGFILLLNIDKLHVFFSSKRLANMVTKIAAISFGIYIIHPIIIYAINQILPFVPFSIPLLIKIFIEICVVFGSSYILVAICKKIPLLNLIF